jgi:hypothetical protein
MCEMWNVRDDVEKVVCDVTVISRRGVVLVLWWCLMDYAPINFDKLERLETQTA